MMTPRDAIACGQVWLRPFGHFAPLDQGYMGFSSSHARDKFYDQMDCGALVAIWIRSKNGESGWVGKFRGILQLQKNKVFAGDYSSKKGNDLRLSSDKDFSFAIGAVRAWKAEPTPKVRMAGLIPSMWPGMTQTIGEYSAKMIHDEVPNIEGLKVREVSVFGQKPVSSVAFTKVRHLFDE